MWSLKSFGNFCPGDENTRQRLRWGRAARTIKGAVASAALTMQYNGPENLNEVAFLDVPGLSHAAFSSHARSQEGGAEWCIMSGPSPHM